MDGAVNKRVGEAPVKSEYMLPPLTYCHEKQKFVNEVVNIVEDKGNEDDNSSILAVEEEKPKKQVHFDLNDDIEVVNDNTSHDTSEKDDDKNNFDSLKPENPIEGVQPPKKKQKGQNKARPRTVPKQKKETRLCPHLLVNEDCEYQDACNFSHDIEGFLKTKPANLGDVCVNFTNAGRCRYGIECMFSKQHTTEDIKNIIDKEKFQKFHDENYDKKNNTLSRPTVIKIRKRNYKYPRYDKYVAEMKGSKDNNVKLCNGDTNPSLDVREKKNIDFAGKLYLAPLTTLGNLPFRQICKRLGADITCGEMTMATRLLQSRQAEWALIKRHPSEDIFGVQVCGGFPDALSKVTELINAECNVDFIDLNLGCPIDLVYKKGEGSALMGRLSKLEKIIKGMVAVSDVPITIKMRTGISENSISAHKVIPMVKEWGVDLITLHGRTREQRYTKDADWDYINHCAELASPVPLFGNGDILSYQEANTRHQTSGYMIARGALIKPWIFTEIKEQRDWDISSHERLELLRDFTNAGLMHWGSDFKGVENTRRFLLEWLSFLCRYIPVGLLEVVPQKINERAPRYFGRNDLETIFASDDAADWVKISEMLLGPVPDNFNFIPKHKANSYK